MWCALTVPVCFSITYHKSTTSRCIYILFAGWKLSESTLSVYATQQRCYLRFALPRLEHIYETFMVEQDHRSVVGTDLPLSTNDNLRRVNYMCAYNVLKSQGNTHTRSLSSPCISSNSRSSFVILASCIGGSLLEDEWQVKVLHVQGSPNYRESRHYTRHLLVDINLVTQGSTNVHPEKKKH